MSGGFFRAAASSRARRPGVTRPNRDEIHLVDKELSYAREPPKEIEAFYASISLVQGLQSARGYDLLKLGHAHLIQPASHLLESVSAVIDVVSAYVHDRAFTE